MQESSEELGAGHEDTVGQQEVTEECLCWAGLGMGRDFRSQVIAQQYEQLKHTPLPPKYGTSKGINAQPDVFSTPTKSTSCQLPTWTNPAPDEVRPQ